jgi:hypothetical protein
MSFARLMQVVAAGSAMAAAINAVLRSSIV